MLTRYFSTSKPIHLVLASIALIIVYLIINLDSLLDFAVLSDWLNKVLLLIVLLFSFYIFAFFTAKNNLTASSSYKLFFFVLFLASIPLSLKDGRLILSNMFVLLAMRRIISLRTQQNTKKKLLDAALWISLASICYFWSFLFFALIFGAMMLYNINSAKNIVIPFLGLTAVIVVTCSYNILTTADLGSVYDYILPISFDFSTLNAIALVIALTWLISFLIWASFFYLSNLKDQPKIFRAAHFLVLLSAGIAFLIAVVSPSKNSAEFIYLAAPFGIITGNYIQTIKENWFSEILLWICLLLPLVVRFIN